VNVHSGQADQRKVIEFYGREVLPRVKKAASEAGGHHEKPREEIAARNPVAGERLPTCGSCPMEDQTQLRRERPSL
jgi:hypothetical protein